ncbi:MAG: transposase [Desulfurivibrionaceae bacterium]
MPRKARIDIPGLLQHVIVRGIERRKIFIDDYDRQIFLARFSSLLEETGTDCFAWALLGNHFHLLLRCNRIELSRFMRRLLTGYAVNFNHRHRRSGHLFQNRYKSIICEEEVYLLELIRYIHLNPLRAEIVSDLEFLGAYPWSGHAVLLGKGKLVGQVTDEVLRLFGENLSDARRNYRQFVADGVPLGKRPELVGGGLRRSQKASGLEEEMESFDDRVLGSGAFVEALQHDANLKAISPPKLTLLEIQKIAGKLFEVEPNSILRRTKTGSASEARSFFCYIAVRLIGEKGIAVGEFLGMGPTGVSRAVRRGEQILQGRQDLESRLKDLLSQ